MILFILIFLGDLDSISIAFGPAIAVNNEKVLLWYAQDSKPIPRPAVSLISLKNEAFNELKDGRIEPGGWPFIGKFNDGFIGVSPLGRIPVDILDGDGKFLKKKRVADFDGWDPNLEIFHLHFFDDGIAIATVIDRTKQDHIQWGVIDFHNQMFSFDGSTSNKDGSRLYYIGEPGRLFQVNQYTGDIHKVTENGIKKVHSGEGNQKSETGKDLPLLEGSYQRKDWVFLVLRTRKSVTGEILPQAQKLWAKFDLRNGSLEKIDSLPITHYEGKDLKLKDKAVFLE